VAPFAFFAFPPQRWSPRQLFSSPFVGSCLAPSPPLRISFFSSPAPRMKTCRFVGGYHYLPLLCFREVSFSPGLNMVCVFSFSRFSPSRPEGNAQKPTLLVRGPPPLNNEEVTKPPTQPPPATTETRLRTQPPCQKPATPPPPPRTLKNKKYPKHHPHPTQCPQTQKKKTQKTPPKNPTKTKDQKNPPKQKPPPTNTPKKKTAPTPRPPRRPYQNHRL